MLETPILLLNKNNWNRCMSFFYYFMVRFLKGSKQIIMLTFHFQNYYMQILDANYCFLLLSVFTVFFAV